jgi:hypothetical protein
MRRNVFLAATMAVLLVATVATTALAADGSGEQYLDVEVLADDMLSIWVESVYFGEVLPPASRSQGFQLGITNTTLDPWQVTVDGADLTAGYWECFEWDEYGEECLDAEYVEVGTIPSSNVLLHGPSLGDTVVGYSTALSESPALFMTGAARTGEEYNLSWWGGPPQVDLTVPGNTPAGWYHTAVYYTIMNTY